MNETRVRTRKREEEPTARVRKRKLIEEPEVEAADSESPKATKEMRDLAKTMFGEGKIKNAATGKHDKARKALYSLMNDLGITEFKTKFRDPEGNLIPIRIIIDEPEGEMIDMEALWNLCGQNFKKFLPMISATKKAVEDHLGKSVVLQCTKGSTGTRNVYVQAIS